MPLCSCKLIVRECDCLLWVLGGGGGTRREGARVLGQSEGEMRGERRVVAWRDGRWGGSL